MGLNTVFGKVKAQIQFLHSGADGIPLAQAFRFIDMDGVSRERFSAAAAQMQSAGFSDVGQDIAEYAVMMAVILVLVAGTVRLIGSSATNTFATVGSSITQ